MCDPARGVGAQRRRDRLRTDFAHQALGRRERLRAAQQQRVDDLAHALVEFIGLNQFMDETEPVGLGGIEALGAQHIAARGLFAERADDIRADGGRDEAEPGFAQAELRIGRRDRDVAGGNQPHAARVHIAVHARDHRLRTLVDRVQHVGQAQGIGFVLVEGVAGHLLHPVEVGTGTKRRALRAEDHHAHLGIAVERDEGLVQGGDQSLVEGIAHLGTVEGDERHRTIA